MKEHLSEGSLPPKKKARQIFDRFHKSYSIEVTNSGQEYSLYLTKNQAKRIALIFAKEMLFIEKQKDYDGAGWEQCVKYYKDVIYHLRKIS